MTAERRPWNIKFLNVRHFGNYCRKIAWGEYGEFNFPNRKLFNAEVRKAWNAGKAEKFISFLKSKNKEELTLYLKGLNEHDI